MSTHQNKQKVLQAKQGEADRSVQATAHGSDLAPIVYFDGAVAFGINGHSARVELAAQCTVPVTIGGKPDARARTLITAHLRGTPEAFTQLRDAIDKMLESGTVPAPAAAEEKA